MPTARERPLPAVGALDRPFWTGGGGRQLLIQGCDRCGIWIHPPGPVCPSCLGRELSWRPSGGTGTVYSFTVNYQPWSPDMPVPYIVAAIELDDQPGLRLLSNLIDCDPAAVAIGMPVEVEFEDHGDIHIPLFRPRARG